MKIRKAGLDDIPVIHKLAHEIWWPAYENILSEEQINFMLDKMYSEEALRLQIEEGNEFLLAERGIEAVAFVSWSYPAKTEEQTAKLHKIYIHPSEQGKGTGRKLISFVENKARKKGGKVLELNVNRNNPALYFYKKMGFQISHQADIPYYQFYMNDYIMRKYLQ